ncbi:MAG: hypothetical protein KOO60_01445 [Gemmatimonadales bacterium]|nr:hypothetical protein [Gemmatimonadales bacterium]
MKNKRDSANRFGQCGVLLVLLALVLSSQTMSLAQTPDTDNTTSDPSTIPNEHKWGLSFGGVLMDGRVTPAFLPVGEGYSGGMIPIENPFGFGLSIDYNVNSSFRFFLDGNFYSYQRQVGVEGDYSSSFWVNEMTDYESNLIGPFTEDAFFYMRTTGFRLGAKYGFQRKGFRPWVGVGLGFYAWNVDYANADRTGSWGSDYGTLAGVTYLFGVDFIFGRDSENPIMITLFGDLASPVAKPIIDDLFQDSWTWENSGGSHIMGPDRLGVSIGFWH